LYDGNSPQEEEFYVTSEIKRQRLYLLLKNGIPQLKKKIHFLLKAEHNLCQLQVPNDLRCLGK